MTLAALVIALAFLGEAIFGFAGGLISVPLLGLLLGVKDAVTTVLVFQLLMGVLLYSCRHDIDRQAAKRATVPVILGTVVGTNLLGILPGQPLKLLIAALIVSYLLREFLRPNSRIPESLRPAAHLIGGGAGGFLQGLIGLGGPPFLIYLNELKLSKQSFRATIIWLLFVSNVVRLPISIQAGLFNEVVLNTVLYSLPGFLVALIAGQRMHGKLPDRLYRLTVYGVLALSAVSICFQAMF